MEVFVFLLFIGLIVVAVQAQVAQNRRANAAWQSFALSHDLEFTEGDFSTRRSLQGTVKGTSLHVHEYDRGSGKTRKRYTRLSVQLPHSLGLGLELREEHLFSGVSKFFGGQDLEVGDEEFDAKVVVRGRDEEAIRAFLTPARRARTRRFLMLEGEGVVSDTEVRRDLRKSFTKAGELSSALAPMLVLARALSRDTGSDPLEVAAEAQARGRIDDAMAALAVPQTPPSPPPSTPSSAEDASPGTATEPPTPTEDSEFKSLDAEVESLETVDESLLRGQIHLLADRPQQAREEFARAKEQSPGDVEADGWLRALDAPAATTTPPSPDTAQTPLEDESEEDVFDRLFGAKILSFDAQRRFDAEYKNQDFTVSGVLEHLDPFSFDLVFGTGKGVKAVIAVREIASSSFATSTVRVIASLASGQEGADAPQPGDRVTVTGRLVKLDAFMRNLFIDSAHWTGGPESTE